MQSKSKVRKVIVVGGGEIFNTYSEYIAWLRKLKLRDSNPSWKSNLAIKLAKYNVDIIEVRRPNTFNAKYLEWKIMFDKYLNTIDKYTTLVGHSLGAMFLLKYLSENKKIEDLVQSIHLVAPQYLKALTFSITESELPNSEKYLFYQSVDDEVITYDSSTTKKIQDNNLGQNQVYLYKNRGHFLQEDFPEIIHNILNYEPAQK